MEKFPTWAYGPNGQSAIFEAAGDIPAGWHDHPSKVEEAPANTAQATAQTARRQAASGNANPPKPPVSTTPAPVDNKSNATDLAELDAHGHPFDPTLHAATRSKTKDGLWRLKVGSTRPAALEGYPKPTLDL